MGVARVSDFVYFKSKFKIKNNFFGGWGDGGRWGKGGV